MIPEYPGAVCAEVEPDLWFSDHIDDIDLARQMCGDCPVRGKCLQGAAQRREEYGVWGGFLFRGGKPVRRDRPGPEPQPHGTEAAYNRHKKNGTPLCAACAELHPNTRWPKSAA